MSFLFYIFNILILLSLIWLLYRTSVASPIKKVFFPALVLKLVAGWLLGALYLYYYTGGDTFEFHREAIKLVHFCKSSPGDYLSFLVFSKGEIMESMQYGGQPRALFLVKILSLVNLITNNSYWISSLYFSLFGFAGLWILADRLSRIYRNSKVAIVFSVLFFPSVVFWSSGIIKEALALGAMGFLLASFLAYLFRQKKLSWLVLTDVLMIFILWNTKYYYSGILLLLIAAIIFTLLLKNKMPAVDRSPAWQVLLFSLFCALCLVIASFSHPNFNFNRISGVIFDNYHAFMKKSDVNDVIYYYDLEPNWLSMLTNAPKALLSGLFRPFLGERTDLLKIIAGVENLLILILTVTAFFNIPRKLTPENRLLLLAAIIYCVVLSVFLALSTPNFGTLVRYKVGFLPVLLLICTLKNPLIDKLNTLIK